MNSSPLTTTVSDEKLNRILQILERMEGNISRRNNANGTKKNNTKKNTNKNVTPEPENDNDNVAAPVAAPVPVADDDDENAVAPAPAPAAPTYGQAGGRRTRSARKKKAKRYTRRA